MPTAEDKSPGVSSGAARRRWLGRGLVAALLIAAGAYLLRDLVFGKPVQAVRAARGDIVQTVVASGRIMTPQRVSVGAVTTGRVARIPVKEGQTVRRGDVLVELDDNDERAALDQARASVAQAEARVRQLRDLGLPAAQQALLQAEATVTQVRRQFDRTRELKAKGFVSQAALDEAQRNLDVAESQLRSAQLQVQSNSPAGSDFVVAQTALAQARAGLGAAQARLEDMVILTPVDGILIGRAVEPGNIVQPGKELMALAPVGETQVVVQIDEKNLAQLKIGQKALGSADAFPRERFPAELVYINPGIDASRGSVEVKLRVPNPPAYLRQDMTVSVDMEVARRANAVVVPAEAVHDANGASPWVLVVDGGHARRRQVELGLKGSGRVEIAKGVAPGDYLVPASQQGVGDGQRVRVVAPSGS